MTKITLSSLAFILAGLLSLSSAHPIEYHGGSNGQGGNDVDSGDGSGRWPGGMSRSSWRGRPSSVSESKNGYTGTGTAMTESAIPTVTPSVSEGAINGTSWGHTKGPGGDMECDDSSSDTIPGASRGHTKDTGGDMECDDTSSEAIPTRTGSPSNGGPPKSSAVPRPASGSIPTETRAPTRSPSMSSAIPSATSEGRPGNGTTATAPGIETQREATVAAATSGKTASSSDGQSGKATWYEVGLGSCGETDSDSDLVVALATKSMSGGESCNKSIKITDPSTGKTATAKVRDTCPSCAAGDLDMSPTLFKKFQSLDAGVFDVKWNFE